MTREQIIAKKNELLQKSKDLQKAEKLLRLEFEALFIECEHPDMSRYTERDGSSGGSCPDCGYVD
jgi:hypothetical protein